MSDLHRSSPHFEPAHPFQRAYLPPSFWFADPDRSIGLIQSHPQGGPVPILQEVPVADATAKTSANTSERKTLDASALDSFWRAVRRSAEVRPVAPSIPAKEWKTPCAGLDKRL